MRATRRSILTGGTAAAVAAAAPRETPAAPSVYTRIGVQPFINLTATYTINGGALTLPEVKAAMDEASHFSVNLEELMEKAGARIASLLGAESAIVTSGCAAALSHATAACLTGGDPELMVRLPDLTGMKSEVLMAKASRNAYDHAFRAPGPRIVEYDTRDEFHARLGERTAVVAVLGTAEAKGPVRLEEIAEAAHKRGVPVIVDAAAELPLKPNPYLSRGADLVAYSGGKILRGPQCAGLLIGDKDLIRAAWVNSAPHHAWGRAMKAGKEEIMGMVAAVELWTSKRDIHAEYRIWENWFGIISSAITKIPGVATRVLPAAGASPFPVLQVSWDPERTPITAGEVYDLLMKGEPRIMSHAEGPGHSFIIRPVSMKPEHPPIVARRLAEILRAPAGKKPAPVEDASDLAGQWDVEIEFAHGRARHSWSLTADAQGVKGTHTGRKLTGEIRGTVSQGRVRLASAMPVEGVRLAFEFEGAKQASGYAGEVEFGEYGRGRWAARRQA